MAENKRTMRIIHKFSKDQWVEVKMGDVKPNDLIRMFDGSLDKPQLFEGIQMTYVVVGFPYINEEGIWTVEALFANTDEYKTFSAVEEEPDDGGPDISESN